MKLPSPIARSQALGQGKSKMRPALGENPVIRSSDRGSIPLASTTAHRYEPERLFLGTVFVLTYKTAEGQNLRCFVVLGFISKVKFGDTLISLLFSSALRQRAVAQFFYIFRARTREGCFLSLKMNEIHKKFALTNGNPGSAPPCLIKAPSRQNCRQERRES